MAPTLDSRHHTFLQAVMNRGPLSEKSATAMFKALMAPNSGAGFVPFLGAINKELEFVKMEVKKVMNQYDGKQFYGIINTLPSKEAKLGTKYSQTQILFFTAVVEAIVQDPSGHGVMSSTAALNLKLDQSQAASSQAATAPIRMTMQAKEETLALLASDQLLSRTADGEVALGVKAFLELRTVFRNLEVPFCAICNEAAIKAQLCSTRDCSMRVHSYCISRRFLSCNQRPKCSGCGADWQHPVKEEESANEEDNIIPIATQEPTQKSGRRSRLKGSQHAVPGSDEDDPTPVQKSGKRSRLKGKQIVAPADDEEEDEDVTPLQESGERSRLKGKQIVAPVDDEEEDQDVTPLQEAGKRSRLKGKQIVAPVDDEEEDQDVTPLQEAGKRSRLKGKQIVAPADDEEEDQDVPPLQKSGKRSRLKRKRIVAPADDDDEEDEELTLLQMSSKQSRLNRKRRVATIDDEDEQEED